MFLSSDKQTTKDNLIELRNQRIKTQPQAEDTCGSVFKNPPGNFAGALIERSGLKGFKIGSASISKLHANFIININSAKFSDVMKLIEIIKKKVLDKFNINLDLEVKIYNDKDFK